MKIQVYIYGLQDPNDSLIKYVGKTIQPLKVRLNQHIYSRLRSRNSHLEKSKWIQSLIDQGQKPEIVLLETTNKRKWKTIERKWFDFYKIQLFNFESAIGVGGTTSHVYKWEKKYLDKLGKVADSIIAEEMGATRKAVSYQREKFGIPAPYDRTRNTPPPLMGGHNKIDIPQEIIDQFGTMPDYKLAEIAGCSKPVIARRRKILGIKSYAEQTGNNGKIKKGDPHRRWEKG